MQEFKDLDDDKDNALDLEELTGMFHHHINDKVETKLTAVAMKDKDTDKNGALTLEEFYQHLSDPNHEEEDKPPEISDEEKEAFKKLDMDNSGTLTLKELKAWESGTFHSEEAMKKMFQVADKDSDNQVTADELDAIREEIATAEHVDAHGHLEAWVQHGEL
jgi:Ca2+-binding EF-hand superfamily protein